jgi:hypothetical protein
MNRTGDIRPDQIDIEDFCRNFIRDILASDNQPSLRQLQLIITFYQKLKKELNKEKFEEKHF